MTIISTGWQSSGSWDCYGKFVIDNWSYKPNEAEYLREYETKLNQLKGEVK